MTQRKTPNKASTQKNFIWLFGENLGNTMDNNSWYSFIEIVNDPNFADIDIYYIVKKTSSNCRCVKNLPLNTRKQIVWRNSQKHKRLYKHADMFFVSLSYRDILPDCYGSNNKKPKPTIYLQHGVTAMKKLGYNSHSYKNSLWRFVCYTENEQSIIKDKNEFRDYQLYLCPAMPRWRQLARLSNNYHQTIKRSTANILWFITWREYLSKEELAANFYKKISEIATSDKLKEFLRKHDSAMTICIHHMMNVEKIKELLQDCSDCVKIVLQKDVNIMRELVKANLVITDYSSIGFDATVIGKPVLFYQFDRTRYLLKRDLYIDLYDDINNNYSTAQSLLDAIINRKKWQLNSFFSDKLMSIDKNKLLNGEYTKKMFSDFAAAQRNKISFIGYNFYGRGGTVSATKALSEALLERGYLVDLYCLKKNKQKQNLPPGLLLRNFYAGGKSLSSKLKRLIRNPKYFGSLDYDINKPLLIPYVGLALRNFLDTCNSHTVVSTRETLHGFLANATNPNIENKIFFFHTPPDVINDFYPGLMEEVINDLPIKKAAFVTEQSREGYKRIFNFDGYKEYSITGNTLLQDDMVQPEDIHEFDPNEHADNRLNGICLMRLSPDRIGDIDHMLDFTRYLKQNNINNIFFDLYGTGECVDYVISQIDGEGLGKYVRYRGLTVSPYQKIRNSDFLVDFSLNHSFGMIYIEAVLNGKMCFAAKNEGSSDVLRGINGSIYNSWDDLYLKIMSIPGITQGQLTDNYATIATKYGHKTVVNNFEKLLDRRIDQ